MISNYLKIAGGTITFAAAYAAIMKLLQYVRVEDGTVDYASAVPIVIAAVIGVTLLVWAIQQLWQQAAPRFDKYAAAQARRLDKIEEAYVAPLIVLAAGLSLFFELAMIRWQSSIFPVFAFYKNFSLLACFCGLGLGYALAKNSRIPLGVVLPLTAAQVVLLTFLHSDEFHNIFLATPITEQKAMGTPHIGDALLHKVSALLPIYLLMTIVFLLTALSFIPVGQLCGRLMERTRRLQSYGLNLLGSALGVALIVALSWIWTPAPFWFVIVAAAVAAFELAIPVARYVALISASVVMLAMLWPSHAGVEYIYSPYQLVERSGTEEGYLQITTAGTYYQRVYDLRGNDPALRSTARYYELPYWFKPNPESVAIVGAGTGNDVAAALRKNAQHVEAIEIDPVILRLGRLYHPEQPYADPRVTRTINDARTFFRTTPDSFDLIVYGVLDSHTLLSHASSVRLDSFVYTQEGLNEAYARLKPGGVMALSFTLLHEAQADKIYHMMQNLPEAGAPLVVQVGYDNKSTTAFFVKKGGELYAPYEVLSSWKFKDITVDYANAEAKADIPTDDWPFFYMPKRVYPFSYLIMLGLIIGLTVFLTKRLLAKERIEPKHMPFFFLGAGFMLIETKAITELGLIFGNTWHVIAVTIIGILIMVYFANALVARWQPKQLTLIYIALLLAIAFGYYVTTHGGVEIASVWRYPASVLLLVCPIFFSGIAFSSELARAKADISPIMAYNLIGAMLGGILEYNSMYFGFAFLYLIAIGLYVAALVTSQR